MRVVLLAIFAALFIAVPLAGQPGGDRATPIKPGQTCPPGTTEIRPRQCLGPQGGTSAPAGGNGPAAVRTMSQHPSPRPLPDAERGRGEGCCPQS